MRRQIDLLEHTIEALQALEHQYRLELDADNSDTYASIQTKNRITALRVCIIEEVKASILAHKRRQSHKANKSAPLRAA